MCLEDLKLGRGRFPRETITVGSGGTGNLPADSTRVALLLSFSGISYYDATGGIPIADFIAVSGNAGGGLVPILQGVGPMPPTVLRIEDLGQLITGPIKIVNVAGSGLGVATVVSICTEVQAAPAMRDYKP